MDVDEWWPRLDAVARQWLIDHNGEPVPDDVADAVALAGGPGRADAAWSWDDDSAGRIFEDSVIDRIEALANDEV